MYTRLVHVRYLQSIVNLHHDYSDQSGVNKSRNLGWALSKELHRDADAVKVENVVGHHGEGHDEQKEKTNGAERTENQLNEVSARTVISSSPVGIVPQRRSKSGTAGCSE